ncbi:flagellar hook-associated protein FlgK (plasmid) [Paracoccus sp. TK19116]|uniref:Flagellar hook-associated protein 1 n=1 Tax=Paracoccus albicereus TaxID=2922394 RepID=A0ABT1MLI2_9RHOB|nr:flagellar hook-associated protein FlgK [Paracoccus albicereus]MCQ0969147.1 flagellar hook-associated protein FlgK [Paracoccus albicereus]
MSITRALSNAVSGLTMNARGSETVANNIANVMTEGYGRREMGLSSQGFTGGVRVDGIARVVNSALVGETRNALGSQTEAEGRAAFLSTMESLIGLTGSPGSLGNALGDFQSALVSASAKPDEELRLAKVVASADTLARRLNAIGDGIQTARSEADHQIASDVANLNANLTLVADLNTRIAKLSASGVDVSALQDQRQNVIDRIAQIVPVQEAERQGGKVAIFTLGGAVLLDGTEPVRIDFSPAGQLTAGMSVGTPPVGRLVVDGKELPTERMSLFAGGSLAAGFAIRDDLAPQFQREIDAVALDLHDRMADPGIDLSRAPGQPSLFTDGGVGATLGAIDGLSSRLALSDAVDPSAGGDVWKIRAGLGATAPGASGDAALLDRMSGVLSASRAMADGTTFAGAARLDGFVSRAEAQIATRRVNADADLAARSARAGTLSTRLMADGVDSDAELSRLLQYEQAYAANAKVIQTIDDMLNAILRM